MGLLLFGLVSLCMGVFGWTNPDRVITDRYGGSVSLEIPTAASSDDRWTQAGFGLGLLVWGAMRANKRFGKQPAK